VGAYAVVLFYVGTAILLGPAIIFVLPFLLPLGISTVTAAHDFASADWPCPDGAHLADSRHLLMRSKAWTRASATPS
jgi:hypothetical protein